MSALSEVKNAVSSILPISTGNDASKVSGAYAVITPLADTFGLWGDDYPLAEESNIRISIYCPGNYRAISESVVSALLDAGFGITGRVYSGRDDATGWSGYSIDVIKCYPYGSKQ